MLMNMRLFNSTPRQKVKEQRLMHGQFNIFKVSWLIFYKILKLRKYTIIFHLQFFNKVYTFTKRKSWNYNEMYRRFLAMY
jgi:hypothetical protein